MSRGVTRKALIAAGIVALVAAGGGLAWRVAAWRAQAAVDAEIVALAEQGLRVGYARRSVAGFPFRLVLRFEDVVAASPTGAWRLSLPWVESGAGLFGRGRIETRLSPVATLALGPRPDLGFGPAPLTATVFAEDARLDTTTESGRRTSTLRAPRLSADLAGPGGAIVARFDIEGPEAGFGDGAGGLFRGRIAAEAARLSSGASDIELAAPVFDAEGAGFGQGSVGAFVASGGVARGALAWEALRVGGLRVAVRGGLSALSAETGAGTMSLVLADGRAAYGLSVDEPDVALDGRVAGRAISERIEARFEMPVTPAPVPQPYALDAAVQALDLDAPLWDALDPAAVAPRGPVSAALRLGGFARMLTALDGMAATGAPPVALSTIDIETATFEGLGATVEVSGRIAMNPAGGAPNGTFAITARDWRGLIARLEALGVLTPERAAQAEALGAAIRRPDLEPDLLEAEVELRDGAVIANGVGLR